MFHSADSKRFTFLMITVLSCGLCHGIDRNGDGLDDQWQLRHGISDANADFDQDGLSELAEYRFGTDPKNAQSKIELNVSRAVNGTKTIAWSGQLHKRYLVQFSENLTTC